MTHTDLSQNGELPSHDDRDEPDDVAGSTSPDHSADDGLTTAQIARAGDPAAEPESASAPTGQPAEPVESTGQTAESSEQFATHTEQDAVTAEQGTTPIRQTAGESTADEQHSRTPFLAPEDVQGILSRWRDIQAGFVDEPRRAVKDADALVADLMQRLAQMFAAEREELESRWTAGGDVSTEDLRQGLRRYRSFFERLLAA